MILNKINGLFKFISKHPLNKYIHKYIYRMDKAYMRKVEGSETFDLSFQYVNSTFNIDRQFNFTRKLSENIDALLNRITVNVEKVLNKKMKKKKNDHESIIGDNIKLCQNGADVQRDMTCEELFTIGGDIRLKLIDQEFQVVLNTPWIKNVSLSSSVMANYFVYPIKFETMFVDQELSKYTWFKSKDNHNWLEVASGYIHVPKTDDIDSFLKLRILPVNSKEIGPVTEIISENSVQASPGLCPFEARHNFTKEKLKDRGYRVVSYNLLADLYADSEYSKSVLFAYCPEYALNINYRKQLILKELVGYNADVMCLQEVDEKVFFDDLEPVLNRFGFQGTYERKGNTTKEGLACFFDRNRFELVESNQVVLCEELENPIFSKLFTLITTNENLTKRLKDRTTSLHVVILRSVENDEYFVVANTHLYFHPNADHIRLIQGTMCITYLKSILKKTEDKYSTRASLIFCGDFNSVPECGTYKLFTTGYCPSEIVDWQSTKDETVRGIDLEQDLIMGSACGTPPYTNYTDSFRDCLDYIYYQRNNFEVTQVIPLPSEEELAANIAIPSVVFPSDHVSLVADLKLL